MNLFIIVGLALLGLVALAVIFYKKRKQEDIFSQGSRVSSTFDACCKKIGKLFGGGA